MNRHVAADYKRYVIELINLTLSMMLHIVAKIFAPCSFWIGLQRNE